MENMEESPAAEAAGNVGGTMLRRTADADLFLGFTNYLVKVMGRSPRTAESYVAAVKRTCKFLDLPARKVGAGDIDGMILLLMEAPWSPSTKRGVVVACRQFHYWGNTSGHWKLNGLASLKTPKVPKRKLPPMTSHMACMVLGLSHTPLLARISFLGLYAGLRIAESASITPQMWFRDRLVFIGKGNKEREVPVHPELLKVKDLILSRQPERRTLESTFSRFTRLHNIRDLKRNFATTHTLRRTFGTEMYDVRGVPWEIVARLLGHGEDVTAQYASIGWDRLEASVWSVNYHSGPVQLSFF